jgi:serine/threonine protein kinase
MAYSNKDLFEHFCDLNELSIIQQKSHLNAIKVHQPELANKLVVLIDNNCDLTQVFTDSILNFTDENKLASIGDRLKNYQLTQSLGNGGMGQVFKAERCDGKIAQTVAIKFLHPLFYQYQSGKLLLQEAQALAKLNHPNIASIYDISETENGNAYIIMEYVEGVTLDVYLQQNNLSVDNKLSLFNQIADAVLESHNHQIIHADIKPSNVLITNSGQAKLIDFGVMQLAGELAQTAPKHITHYLCAMTVNYASPEQLTGAKATISSDIYSLGSLLYFILSGKSPFEEVAGKLTGKIEHINTQAPEHCAMLAKVPFKSDLIAIVNNTLSKRPKDRYRTVTDLINDIQAFGQKKTVSVSASNRVHNALKFFYRNRIVNTATICIFMIVLVAFLQINAKNELLTKEKKSLENVSQVLKSTFTKRDKSIADAHLKNDALYLPDPAKLAPKQYIEIMSLMFDDYYFQDNQPAYSQVIDTLIQWLMTQDNVDRLSQYLVKYRKVVSDNKENENHQEYADILSAIMAIDEPLSPSVLELFEFKNSSPKLAKTHFLPLFLRLEKELIRPEIPVKQLFLFHRAGGRIYIDNNSRLSVYHLKKAYELAKSNSDEIKLWLFVDTLFNLISQLRNWKGPTQDELVSLKNELHELINQMDNKKIYRSKLSLLLAFQVTFSMDSVANILQQNNITFKSSLEETSFSDAVMIRIQSAYFKSLGQYEKAIKLANKAAALKDNESGHNDSYYNYFIVRVAYSYLEAGDTVKAMSLIEGQIIPFITKYESKDSLGYYQAVFCYKLALNENSERLKNLCFDGFNNLRDNVGIDNYWTRYTASGVVSWYTLQPVTEAEKYYVKLLESDFEEASSQEKINRGFILERYFISRNKIEKSEYYQTVVAQSIEDYYGSVDAIDRYYHQIMVTELALLKGNKAKAIATLANIKQKMCSLADINSQKIKYLKLQKSLNQASCLNK